MRFNRDDVEAALNSIREFVETHPFQRLLAEMRKTPKELRHKFVREVVINKDAQAERGIVVPERMILQRSVFMDNRPTLFCVSKYLSDGKRKVTITFDDPE